MSSELTIAVAQEEGKVPVTLFRLKGPLDGHTYKDLESKAAEAVAAGSKNLVLDLSGVTYMGSAGFRAIHAVSNMLEPQAQASATPDAFRKSTHMVLLSPSEPVLKVIKTLGFDAYLSIRNDLDEALSCF